MKRYRNAAVAILAIFAAPLASAPASSAPLAAPSLGASMTAGAMVQKVVLFGHRRGYGRTTYYRRPMRSQYYSFRTRPDYYNSEPR